jgi:tetratricopeptide (TPR) repeat protein
MDAAAPKPRRSRRGPAPTTPDPIEIAMEAEAGDTAPDSPARTLLINQNRLIIADLHHRGWQIASERAGFALKVLTGVAGLAVAFGLATLVWQAAHARGLVVAPFSVPPELSARGLTGEVVASQVLDKLTQMQEQTSSGRRRESTAGDWGRDLKVVIPSTGVSLGDLQSALRQWLGQETRVSGEVYRTPAGAVLSVRLAGRPAFQAIGDEQNLDALAAQVAEQIMKTTQSYRYGIWLTQNGRGAERLPLLKAVAASNPDVRERAWAWRGIAREAGVAGDWPASRAAALRAITLKPDLAWAWEVLGAAERGLGHSEAAMAANRKALVFLPRDKDLEPWARDPMVDRAQDADDHGDLNGALAALSAQMDPRFAADLKGQVFWGQVRELVGLHRLAEARAKAGEAFGAADAKDSLNWAGTMALIRWRLLLGAEDWEGMIAMSREPNLAGRQRLFGATPAAQRAATGTVQLAFALMMTGDLAGAAAILDSTPLDCDRCLIGRGQLAAAKGDAAGAARCFAKAAAITPSLPQAPFEWGRVKLARNDKAGAIKLFEMAHKLGPRWAEPFDYWGRALLAGGDAKGAAAKFRQADKYAPKWGRNHMLWGEALAAQGNAAEAMVQFKMAADMDLTAVERAELGKRLGL